MEDAAASEPDGPINILVNEEHHGDDLILESPGETTISGGWDESFSGQTSQSSFGSMTIQGGTVIIDSVVLE